MPRSRQPKPTRAETLRAHREAFELALELRCTPAQAQEELNRRAAWAKHQEATRRLAAKMNAPIPRALTDPEPPRSPWWQERD